MRALLTACSTVLLEKLTGSELVKKFPAFYGIRRFIIAFTTAHHLSLSWASSIQSMPPHPTSWRSILILSSHLRLVLLSGLFQNMYYASFIQIYRSAETWNLHVGGICINKIYRSVETWHLQTCSICITQFWLKSTVLQNLYFVVCVKTYLWLEL